MFNSAAQSVDSASAPEPAATTASPSTNSEHAEHDSSRSQYRSEGKNLSRYLEPPPGDMSGRWKHAPDKMFEDNDLGTGYKAFS